MATYEAKTKSAAFDPATFLASVDSADRQAEALQLLQIFAEVTGFPPRLWGSSMVGFGRYAYTYASGHSGESLATGFAPRKAELSLYILPGYSAYGAILDRLGPHRLGKACLYARRLDRLNQTALRDLIRAGLDDLGKQWTVHPV